MPVDVVLDALLGTVALALVCYLVVVVRRHYLVRGGGTFDCSLRLTTGRPGRGWALGLARYADDCLEWYRFFSWSMRPRRVVQRAHLRVEARRPPTGHEALTLVSGAVVLACSEPGGSVELAMSEEALTGFLAWLEAAPPGRYAAGY